MSKKLLISTVAALALSSAAMAGSSIYVIGQKSDNNVSLVASEVVQGKNADINASAFATGDTNVTDADKALFVYVPDIQMGNGNIITVTAKNGAINAQNGNKLYLVDLNASIQDDGTNVYYPVVASMIDKTTDSKGNYTEMIFKFVQDVDSNHWLASANKLKDGTIALEDDNATQVQPMAFIISKGTKCGTHATLAVTKATDQSGTPLASGLASNGGLIRVVKDITVANCAVNVPCTIQLPDELGFGTQAATSECPTCSNTTQKPVLTCNGQFALNHQIPNTGLNVQYTPNNIDMKINGDFTGIATVKDITNNNSPIAFTIDSAAGTATASTTTIQTGVANPYTIQLTADGKTKMTARTFALNLKADNNTIDIDTINDWLRFVDGGVTMFIPYVNGHPDYRTFIRISVSNAAAEAPIDAIVTGEDGSTASFTLEGVKAPKNGAVIIEGTDLYAQAVEAGYTGGKRMNVQLRVKATNAQGQNLNVSAVAYMTDAAHGGSQRKLPVQVNGGIIW